MENPPSNQLPHQATPPQVIACVSRVVSLVIDRIAGDRSDVPLMVASACAEALKAFDIEARVMFGQAAWIEVLEDDSVVWAGCWGENFHFWAATQYGEVVDLTTSVAFRKRAHSNPMIKAKHSPPILWSAEVPKFYRYLPEGVAELELLEKRDVEQYEKVLREIREKCTPKAIEGKEPEFINEPILCPERKLLDDSLQTFRKFDRVISVRGIPDSPI